MPTAQLVKRALALPERTPPTRPRLTLSCKFRGKKSVLTPGYAQTIISQALPRSSDRMKPTDGIPSTPVFGVMGWRAQAEGLPKKTQKPPRGKRKLLLPLTRPTSRPEIRSRTSEAAAQALVRERSLAPFQSIRREFTHRVPELRKDELNTLAGIGALNFIGNSPQRHGPSEGTISSQRNHQSPNNLQSEIKNQSQDSLCLCASVGKALFTRNHLSPTATPSGRSRKPFAAPDRCSKNSPNPTAPRPSIA